ncbi:hypothetical protein WK80_22370 [Burkholderia multivorans]|uniref:hypothetical protein n=1 Tax=Burkholderia multivorans TaxID=87883 RepID=UPI0007555F99|nr:hypothetical protein [Burkholderia multivorans]KVQ85547.1 hypothetical protein WK07_04455 [Burkholderia multivorans]KVV22336.1 hypothetical protein WK80_22370 [Burkholderia multivorans]MBU9203091.1 hypothetical protein [Burkholderia multivorans]MCA8385330.1 hypothetical protein [Burkholderia multivorans]
MKHEGRMAWRANGVTARNPHRFGTPEWLQWDEGYSGAMWDARHAALDEAAAYHALSVRDNAKDREWAEKLAARLA